MKEEGYQSDLLRSLMRSGQKEYVTKMRKELLDTTTTIWYYHFLLLEFILMGKERQNVLLGQNISFCL